MTSIPTLISDRLIIRAAQPSDLAELTIIRSDERVGNFTGGTRDSQAVWMTLLRSYGLWAMLGYGYWIAEHRQTGEIIAEVGFADFKRGLEPDVSGAPEAGWIVAPQAWGQGYASEAMNAVHDWLDTERPGRSVCIINPDNPVSIRIAQKLGYKEFARTKMAEDPLILFERHTSTTGKD